MASSLQENDDLPILEEIGATALCSLINSLSTAAAQSPSTASRADHSLMMSMVSKALGTFESTSVSQEQRQNYNINQLSSDEDDDNQNKSDNSRSHGNALKRRREEEDPPRHLCFLKKKKKTTDRFVSSEDESSTSQGQVKKHSKKDPGKTHRKVTFPKIDCSSSEQYQDPIASSFLEKGKGAREDQHVNDSSVRGLKKQLSKESQGKEWGKRSGFIGTNETETCHSKAPEKAQSITALQTSEHQYQRHSEEDSKKSKSKKRERKNRSKQREQFSSLPPASSLISFPASRLSPGAAAAAATTPNVGNDFPMNHHECSAASASASFSATPTNTANGSVQALIEMYLKFCQSKGSLGRESSNSSTGQPAQMTTTTTNMEKAQNGDTHLRPQCPSAGEEEQRRHEAMSSAVASHNQKSSHPSSQHCRQQIRPQQNHPAIDNHGSQITNASAIMNLISTAAANEDYVSPKFPVRHNGLTQERDKYYRNALLELAKAARRPNSNKAMFKK